MTKFVRNPRFEAEVRRQAAHDAFLAAKAAAVARATRSVAPVQTRHYLRSIGSQGNNVFTSDPFWHLIEFGSANNAPYAPLRRGVRAAGLRLDEILK